MEETTNTPTTPASLWIKTLENDKKTILTQEKAVQEKEEAFKKFWDGETTRMTNRENLEKEEPPVPTDPGTGETIKTIIE